MALSETPSDIDHLSDEERDCLENCARASEVCEWCADACEACADECERHDHDDCRLCADVLPECTDSCRNMAA